MDNVNLNSTKKLGKVKLVLGPGSRYRQTKSVFVSTFLADIESMGITKNDLKILKPIQQLFDGQSLMQVVDGRP